MELWRFLQHRNASWCWTQTDNAGRTIRQSERQFFSRVDCIADAVRHGYLSRPLGHRGCREAGAGGLLRR
jgi:hypothetical protein